MSRPFRVALLGYGLAGAVFHAPLIAAVDGLELAAIVTRDAERRSRARSDHPAAALLDSPEKVWKRADYFDLAVVAAPNRAHVRLARAAIAAGVGVVVDKPLATSADEARVLLQKVRVAFRALAAGSRRRLARVGRARRGRRTALRPRQSPRRPGSHPVRPCGGGLCRTGSAAHRRPDRRRHLCRVDPCLRRPLASLDERGRGPAGPRFRVIGSQAGYVKYGLDVQEESLQAGRRPDDRILAWERASHPGDERYSAKPS